jgi:uncharacterized membrane protein YkoI
MLLVMFVAAAVRAEGDPGDLAKQLKGVKVTLTQGLKASAENGKPISAKFEVENGKLQLSVYTSKDGSFSEVIVDHKTGKVAKSEPITSGDDLTAAKTQDDTMQSAKTSLGDAVRKAEKANRGYRAVSVVPAKKDGHASAEVTLLKGAQSKTVSEQLD